MLNNYISKLVCLTTLCAFLLQPQWLDRNVPYKASQQHRVTFTKTHPSIGYIFNQSDDENESDDDSEILIASFASTINPVFPVFTEPFFDVAYFRFIELHRLQERPFWLIFRKLIL